MARIFISYSRKDEDFARKLAKSLSDSGGDIWIDVEDIPAGMNWSSAIQQGLQFCEVMIVILTPGAAASRNVEEEWQYYRDKSKPIIPVLLQPAEMHYQLSRIQYIDFHTQDYDTALRQLHTQLGHKGAALNPISVSEESNSIPVQKPLTVRPAGQRRYWVIGAAIAATLLLIVIIQGALNNSGQEEQPTPMATATTQDVAQTVPTNAPLTDTPPIPTRTPSDIPTATNSPSHTPTSIPAGFPGNPVTRNADWTPVIQEFDGVEMVLVPVGCFMMGSEDGEDNERPVHQQCFNEPFWIDHYEVTNEQFERLGGEAGSESWSCDSNPDGTITQEERAVCANFPREGISWYEARAFCESRGARLPTEVEWEYVARGPDGPVYPWGNEFLADNVIFFLNHDQISEVGHRAGGVSWVGSYDLSGNVSEWVSTAYDNFDNTGEFPFPYDPSDGREDLGRTDVYRVMRGGSILDGDQRAAIRVSLDPIAESLIFGFRCARSQ